MSVTKPGTLTSVQDAGRPGHLGKGIPPAGAQDNASFRAANLLVGNEVGGSVLSADPRGAAAIECTLMGPTVNFSADVHVAVTGGACKPKVDGTPIPTWEPVEVQAGRSLAIGPIQRGLRVYLAIGGGIAVPEYLGSRSTMLAAGLGGFEGRALRAGDVLPLDDPTSEPPLGRRFEPLDLPGSDVPSVLRAVRGPQADLFDEESIKAFFTSQWTLSTLTDRMGSRFTGSPLRFRPRPGYLARSAGANASNIVDDIIPLGGVQCPDGAAAIVMGVEHPTAGGYAKIATVISEDIRIVGQMRPGSKATFAEVSHEKAASIGRRHDDLFTFDRLLEVAR
ncbi:biotin-dependent carboxyltransferase family protein [Actinomadura sp. KC06]|uniref:5-oxoprolinase subunit C family protein n=1 Tax=Actinomadura sp. KC06 TaxID=2530369 RepID=UPI001FB57D67|nr:biotin-dependent carboxyltransferase family protein [Actinomadura sp. KC06]